MPKMPGMARAFGHLNRFLDMKGNEDQGTGGQIGFPHSSSADNIPEFFQGPRTIF